MTPHVTRNIVYVVIVIILGVVAWAVMTMPDNRSSGEKIGDAVDALPNGIDKAAEQLEDRTPGEKLGDAVKEVGDDIKDSTDK